jgi:CRISPR type III-B/RAMP module-associated protein Cmr3
MKEFAFFARPLDSAFFGPPDAQSAGETHYARSLFPPPPRAFQGLVRTRLLATAQPPLNLADYSERAKREREDLVGGAERLPQGWQIEGPFALCWDKNAGKHVPWFPAPEFLRRPKNSLDPAPRCARVVPLAKDDHALGGVGGDLGGRDGDVVLGSKGFDDGGAFGGWISAENLRWALTGRGEWDPRGHGELPPAVRRETRAGVALDSSTRRARDHMLFSVEQLRFDGRGGFLGTLRGDVSSRVPADALTQGTAAFGRWNRLVALEEAPDLDSDLTSLLNAEALRSSFSDRTYFWMMLLTPARLTKPLRPTLHGVTDAEQIEIRGAVLGSPLTLGGYSLAERRARPNQRYVPAGSAWLFQVPGVPDDRRGEIVRALNRSHCLGDEEEARMGFGQVLVGIHRK